MWGARDTGRRDIRAAALNARRGGTPDAASDEARRSRIMKPERAWASSAGWRWIRLGRPVETHYECGNNTVGDAAVTQGPRQGSADVVERGCRQRRYAHRNAACPLRAVPGATSIIHNGWLHRVVVSGRFGVVLRSVMRGLVVSITAHSRFGSAGMHMRKRCTMHCGRRNVRNYGRPHQQAAEEPETPHHAAQTSLDGLRPQDRWRALPYGKVARSRARWVHQGVDSVMIAGSGAPAASPNR